MSRWGNLSTFHTREFRCGHCGLNVANNRGYFAEGMARSIYLCPHCDQPTYFVGSDRQIPGIAAGNEVGHLTEELEKLYREARDCCAVGAYTASVLASRKMLMNIGVQQGAAEGQRFIQYVDHLATGGFIPPNGRGWVDHIRKKGNEATHEIALMTSSDAEELITFVEMLLKFIYEFPARVPSA